MNNKLKNLIITILIILIIATIAVFALIKKPVNTNQEIAKCIGSKTILYTQLGCHACQAQEELFGEDYQYLNVIDCWYDHQPCIDNNIVSIPSWIIKGKKYEGVQTIDKLKELTGC